MAFSPLESLQKIPVKTRIIAFAVIIALFLGLFVYFIHIPMNTEVKGLEKAIAEKKATIAQNEERIQRLDELKARVQTLQEQLRLAKEKLPPETEVSGLLRQIQNEVNKAGMTLMLWKPDKRKSDPSGLYDEIPINVALTGGYHNFGVFLDRVAKLPRIVNIQNINMVGVKKDASGSINIGIKCTAVTFAATEKKVETTTGKGGKAKKAQK